MAKVSRFGVSVEAELLREFDALIKKTGYDNRSEAIRDLIRARLVEEEWKDENQETVGVLGLVYDHNRRDLMESLTGIQHRHIPIIISSVHVHLDQHNCLEVIVLKGKSSLIRKTADELLATKNVKHGQLIMTTAGTQLS